LAYPHLRFDIDEKEDLISMQDICSRGVTIESTANEIVDTTLKSL